MVIYPTGAMFQLVFLILGPLLFALYINDLPSVVKYSKLDLYADDAELHYSHSDVHMMESRIQMDLDALTLWLQSSRLCLNVIKSKCMLVGSRQKIMSKSFNVSVGGALLTQVNSIRYLGVLVDSTLSWATHVSSVISRVRHRLATIIRYGSLPPTILCVLYSAFVLSIFDYCDVVWCPTTAKLTSMMIERVHSRFIKRLPVSYRSKFSFTLMERRRFHTAIQIYTSEVTIIFT